MKDFHLSDEEIAELRVAHRRCGDKRAAYRLNAVILLGSGWSAKEVSEALLIDEGTLRGYVKRYQKGGAERLLKDEYRGGLSYLSDPQKRELEAHLCAHTYLCTRDIIRYIERRFGVRYSISGITDLLHDDGF